MGPRAKGLYGVLKVVRQGCGKDDRLAVQPQAGGNAFLSESNLSSDETTRSVQTSYLVLVAVLAGPQPCMKAHLICWAGWAGTVQSRAQSADGGHGPGIGKQCEGLTQIERPSLSHDNDAAQCRAVGKAGGTAASSLSSDAMRCAAASGAGYPAMIDN